MVTLGFLATRFIPGLLVSMFGRQDAELMELGVRTMKTVMVLFPIIGVQIVGSSYFQAVGKPKKSALLSLSRQVLLLMPLLLILPRFWGLIGVFLAFPFSDAGSTVLTTVLLRRELASLNEQKLEHNLNLTTQAYPER